MTDPIEATAAEGDTPGAQSGAVSTPQPVADPDPQSIDWHTPDGSPGYSWGELQQMSVALSKSSLVPAVYRNPRNGPDNVVAIALTGQELGWGVATAMRFIQVIDGKPTVSPEGMLALVRRAGHSVSGKSSTTAATVRGRRKDNGDEMEVTFTIEDATRAKLAGKDNWVTYPEAMLWARALAMLCRRLFSDDLLGAAYVPDEMGAVTNERGEFIETTARDDQQNQGPVEPDWAALKWDRGLAQFDAAMRDTKRMLNLLPQDAQANVRKTLGPPPRTHEYTLNVWAMRHKVVVDAAKELGIAEAFAATTTPELTAMEAPAGEVVSIASDTPLADRVEAPVVDVASLDVDDTPSGTLVPKGEYTPEDDEADAAWVAQALATDDTSTVVADDE